jgi:hypothetical protein
MDNKKNISCIPPEPGSELIYLCKSYKSTKYGDTYKISDVEARSGILFHRGNSVKDTKGCIILGSQFGNLAKLPVLIDSSLGFQNFKNIIGNAKSFEVKIKWMV